MTSKWKRVHNNALAFDAKVEIRRNALDAIGPSAARVFDCYCGPDGEMWKAVWRDAADYLGCDLAYKAWDERRRVICDVHVALQTFELQRFNVFDVDAFGEPWETMFTIAACRRWAKGERGALVLTNGGCITIKLGRRVSNFAATMLGHKDMHAGNSKIVHEALLDAWLERCRVRALARWMAKGPGQAEMLYDAIVFEGI